MKDIFLKLLSMARQSAWVKKISFGVGTFFLGMLFQERYWKALNTSRDAFGVSDTQWHTVAWAIIGVCLPVGSILLTVFTTAEDKQAVADKAVQKAQSGTPEDRQAAGQ